MSLTSHEKIGRVGLDATKDLARILARMSRGCHAENGPVKFKLNSMYFNVFSTSRISGSGSTFARKDTDLSRHVPIPLFVELPGHNLSTLQTDRRTDGRTDGRTSRS